MSKQLGSADPCRTPRPVRGKPRRSASEFGFGRPSISEAPFSRSSGPISERTPSLGDRPSADVAPELRGKADLRGPNSDASGQQTPEIGLGVRLSQEGPRSPRMRILRGLPDPLGDRLGVRISGKPSRRLRLLRLGPPISEGRTPEFARQPNHRATGRARHPGRLLRVVGPNGYCCLREVA